jgi:hypothetical protein
MKKFILYRNERERKIGVIFFSAVLGLYIGVNIGMNIYFYLS